ncbi:MAG: CYCXC family (seleno)protein [Candidatus Acidiferrales bacterium]
MLRKFLVVAAAVSGFAVAGLGAGSLYAQNASAQDAPPAATATQATVPGPMKMPTGAGANHKADIPAYHAEAPKGPLPQTLDPKQFLDAETRNIYTLAAKEKDILYQQPCYCRCDKEVGHKSLLDCFTDYHGSHCMLCKKEAVFTYTESQQGKTAAQIRQEIMDGKWKDVDLSKYDDPLPAK